MSAPREPNVLERALVACLSHRLVTGTLGHPILAVLLAALYLAVTWASPASSDLRFHAALQAEPARWALAKVLLKPAALLAFAYLATRAVCRVCATGLDWRRALLIWAVVPVLTLVPMTTEREPLSNWVNTAEVHLTSPRFRGYRAFGPPDSWLHNDSDERRHARWVRNWDSGLTFVVEALHLVVLIGLLLAAGKLGFGRPHWIYAIAVAVSITGCAATGAMTWTYDLFYNGIATSVLAIELLSPFPTELPSLLAAPFLFALVSGAALVLATTPATKRGSEAPPA